MDRTEVARCVGKIFAYLGCGQREQARQWARKLIAYLQTI